MPNPNRYRFTNSGAGGGHTLLAWTAAASRLRIGLRLSILSGFLLLVSLLAGMTAFNSVRLEEFKEQTLEIPGRTAFVHSATDFKQATDALVVSVLRYAWLTGAQERIDLEAAMARFEAAGQSLALDLEAVEETPKAESLRANSLRMTESVELLQFRIDARDANDAVLFGVVSSLRGTVDNLAEILRELDEIELAQAIRASMQSAAIASIRYVSSGTDSDLTAARSENDALCALFATAKEAMSALPRRQRNELKFAARDLDKLSQAVMQKSAALSGFQNGWGQTEAALEDIETLAAEIRASAARQESEVVAQVVQSAAEARRLNVILAGVGLIGGMLVAWLLAGNVVQPLNRMVAAMNALRAGTTDVQIADRERADEVGDMARALEDLRIGAVEREKLEREKEAELLDRERRVRTRDELLRRFETEVAGRLGEVATATGSLEKSASEMAETANGTNRQAGGAAAAAEQTSFGMQTAATATKQLSTSISDIARQVGRASQSAAACSDKARDADTKVANLRKAAEKIGNVINLINDIAAQTNLLALNATIEAARAGHAGRGFAVVASEVKMLASATTDAIGDVSSHVDAIRSSTEASAEAIEEIAREIEDISAVCASVAVAVDAQNMATRDIASNVNKAADGSHLVSENMLQVLAGAGRTGEAAGTVDTAAGLVAEQSDRLRTTIDDFLRDVRAA